MAKSRQMLKKLLAEPLRARPVQDEAGRGWELTGRASLGGLISGVVGVANTVASPRGFEPVSPSPAVLEGNGLLARGEALVSLLPQCYPNSERLQSLAMVDCKSL